MGARRIAATHSPTRSMISRPSPGPASANVSTCMPAQNARSPAPVRTSARTLGPAPATASRIAARSSTVSALRISGRLSVIVRVPRSSLTRGGPMGCCSSARGIVLRSGRPIGTIGATAPKEGPMTTTAPQITKDRSRTDFDVLIVGAGISGIGAGCYLRSRLPGKSFAILEGREAIGGTWDLFRFPGIRSDSDLFTFGFAFKPWTSSRSIAAAELILAYLHETVAEFDLARDIRFGHRVTAARWSSEDARWPVTAQRAGGGDTVELTCRFLFSGTG